MIPNRTSNRVLLFLAGIISAVTGILILALKTVTEYWQEYVEWKRYKTFARSLEISSLDFFTLAGGIGIALLFLFAIACIITAFRRCHGRKIRWLWLSFIVVGIVLVLIELLIINHHTYHLNGTTWGYYTAVSYDVQTSGWVLFASTIVAAVLYCCHLLIGQSHRVPRGTKTGSSFGIPDPATQTLNNRFTEPEQQRARYPNRQAVPGPSSGTWQCTNCLYINSIQQEICQRCGIRRFNAATSIDSYRKS